MSERLLTVIRESTQEEKLLVLAELMQEVFLAHGRASVPIHDAKKQTVGYLIPQGEPVAMLPSDPAWVAEMVNRLKSTGSGLTASEVVTALKTGFAATLSIAI
jgi:hypothetical protein